MTWLGKPMLGLIYFVTALGGLITRFDVASASAYVQTIFSKEVFPRAAAWNLSLFTSAMILGPLIGGWTVAHFGTTAGYGFVAALYVPSLFMTAAFRKVHPVMHES